MDTTLDTADMDTWIPPARYDKVDSETLPPLATTVATRAEPFFLYFECLVHILKNVTVTKTGENEAKMNGSQWWDSWVVVLLLIVLILGAAVLLGMFFVKKSCLLALKFAPSNRMAFKAVAFGSLASAPLGVFHYLPDPHPMHIVAFVSSFGIYSFVLGHVIKLPEGEPIGVGKGAIVTAVWGAMFIAVAFVVGTAATMLITHQSGTAKEAPLDLTYSPTWKPQTQEPSQNTSRFDPTSAKPVPEAQQWPDAEDQKRMEAVAAAIQTKYPMLDYQSPFKDQGAIDDVVAMRDRFIKMGILPSEALRAAAERVVHDRLVEELNRQSANRNNSIR